MDNKDSSCRESPSGQAAMPRSVLMVAYHYPPAQASGTQRIVGFARYLPQLNWRPLILTVHPMAYEQDSKVWAEDLPGVTVARPLALDTARHLSFKGRYTRLLALPDRWVTWLVTALPVGLWLIWKHKPKMIWSTYPIATSLLIGWLLSRWSGRPWIVDLRDPMVLGRHPLDPSLRKLFVRLEARILKRCHRIVVTTAGLKELLSQRYPDIAANKWLVIANGYDEEVFNDPAIVRALAAKPGLKNRTISLLHSGTLYLGPEERNPAAFLDALIDLQKQGFLSPPDSPDGPGIKLKVMLRASGHDAQIQAMIQERQLQGSVVLLPTVPYRDSLLEMVGMDGLLLFQGEAFDRLIPAKLFEYLRSGRPVFALVGQSGDSRKILDDCGVSHCAPLEDRQAIAAALIPFLQEVLLNQPNITSEERVRKYSRFEGARALAALLEDVAGLS
ncbi:MAG: glycosyltransferase [Magnetococcales bacterium]|nr:glycosyltransferase [Magnetococcales bacterium]